jgi:hypothetical protein
MDKQLKETAAAAEGVTTYNSAAPALPIDSRTRNSQGPNQVLLTQGTGGKLYQTSGADNDTPHPNFEMRP